MTKSECKTAILHLCGVWAKERGIVVPRDNPPSFHPSFSDFYSWVKAHYPGYLRFRTTTGVEYDVEMWFDQEFKQTWRN
jgi:hypothetical protein